MDNDGLAYTAGNLHGTVTISGIGTERTVGTPDLFDVVVYGIDRVELIPKTELAKSLISMWTHGGLVGSMMLRGTGRNEFGRNVYGLSFRYKGSPLVSNGEDPFGTGMPISKEEADACFEFVKKRRAKMLAPEKPKKKRGRKP